MGVQQGTTRLKKNHAVSAKQKSDVKRRTCRIGGVWARGRFERRSGPVEASDVELAAEDESFLFGDAGIELYGSISNPFELGQL